MKLFDMEFLEARKTATRQAYEGKVDPEAFVVQASLVDGDEVGASISSNFPVMGYINRSLTVIQLS